MGEITRTFHGWTGSGRCDGCGLDVASGLGIWTEARAIVGVASRRVPRTRRYYLCIPCTYSEALRPEAPFVAVRP